ncbi:nitrogenase component 1 [Rubrobacter tropicus]|uniref:nitrogenase component 1 n=1 Tax=Rubrobacter tropicus TaxID=2653851 RepID=UPI0014092024|nr:nitrogenase component 1 [Rubrobacter tropicus]
MRLLGGVYEGPGSHGILRLAASMSGVHAVLRAGPGEAYFPALYADRERDGRTAPVTLSPLHEGRRESYAPGDLARDISGVARRHPGAEAMILARSEAALLSGEPVPEVEIPDAGGRPVAQITCSWQTPGMGEMEAAELALEDLVRAHARPGLERTQHPTVNLFGPPVFGPGAAAEYDEAERLLNGVGVEVNARVPLGATVEDLRRLPRAWANVLLYREVGESATLYLQDEHGVGRVTTPMIGAAGTGAALRTAGELCELDPKFVERTVWSELSRTSKLPWYARLERPETFAGRKVAIFGDFSYPLGLGYALAREVGLDVVACGTYLTHLERDFLFHAQTFTEGGFVEDDPEEVAGRLESAHPDLIVGTELEAQAADALNVPFLPLCYPTGDRPFVEKPLMGYAGSSVLADRLDEALGGPHPPPRGRRRNRRRA